MDQWREKGGDRQTEKRVERGTDTIGANSSRSPRPLYNVISRPPSPQHGTDARVCSPGPAPLVRGAGAFVCVVEGRKKEREVGRDELRAHTMQDEFFFIHSSCCMQAVHGALMTEQRRDGRLDSRIAPIAVTQDVIVGSNARRETLLRGAAGEAAEHEAVDGGGSTVCSVSYFFLRFPLDL